MLLSCVVAGPITVPSTLRVGGSSSSLCVEVNGNNANAQRLILANCTGSRAQPRSQAFVSGVGVDPNIKRIQTASLTGSTYCLDVSGSATASGSSVIIYSCSNPTSRNQQWTQDSLGRWSPAHAPTMCLDTANSSMSAGALFVIRPCSNADSQRIAPMPI